MNSSHLQALRDLCVLRGTWLLISAVVYSLSHGRFYGGEAGKVPPASHPSHLIQSGSIASIGRSNSPSWKSGRKSWSKSSGGNAFRSRPTYEVKKTLK